MFNELYTQTKYEPLVPVIHENKYVHKFNSITHFISWVQYLDANFQRRGGDGASDKRERDRGFYQSENLENAYEVIRGVVFDPNSNRDRESVIRGLKNSTKYSEDGYELEIPEVLASSDKPWLSETRRRTHTRIIDDLLFINATYNGWVSGDDAKAAGLGLLDSIYSRKIIPRKLVVVFTTRNSDPTGETMYTFIDAGFRELNDIAKLLHPSVFRRLVFRMIETHRDVAGGYGQAPRLSTERGVIDIQTMCNMPKQSWDEEVKIFLGVNN